MKKQFQTKFSDEEKGTFGNSLITTYACFLDKNVDQCPKIEQGGDWQEELEDWLEEEGYEENHYPSDPFLSGFVGSEDYYFAWGISGRNKEHTNHQVIYKEGRLYHDPHPDNRGLEKINGFIVLDPIDQQELFKEGRKEGDKKEEEKDVQTKTQTQQNLQINIANVLDQAVENGLEKEIKDDQLRDKTKEQIMKEIKKFIVF